MVVDAKCDVSLYRKKGHYFYNVTAAHVDFDLGGLKLQLNNLFEGNKELGMLNPPLTSFATDPTKYLEAQLTINVISFCFVLQRKELTDT